MFCRSHLHQCLFQVWIWWICAGPITLCEDYWPILCRNTVLTDSNIITISLGNIMSLDDALSNISYWSHPENNINRARVIEEEWNSLSPTQRLKAGSYLLFSSQVHDLVLCTIEFKMEKGSHRNPTYWALGINHELLNS